MDIFFSLSSVAGVKQGLKECKVQKGWKTWSPFQPGSPQLWGGGQWIHKSTDSEVKDSWVQTPVLPLSGSETLGKGIKIISGLQGGCESSVRCCMGGQALLSTAQEVGWGRCPGPRARLCFIWWRLLLGQCFLILRVHSHTQCCF